MDSISSNGQEDDLPDDFFDDFNNSDFIESLSIVDTWDGKKPRELEEDLRDLLRSRKEESARESDTSYVGLRRDINKTNRDIKKDKEAKVKEHISKRLNSAIGPPGTELDDFNSETKSKPRRHSPSPVRRRRSPQRKHSPVLHRSRHRKSSSPIRRPRSRSPNFRQKKKNRSPLPFRNRSPPAFRGHSPISRDSRRHRSSSRSRQRSRSRRRSRLRDEDAKYRQADYSSAAPSVYPQEIFPPQNYPNAEGFYPPLSVIPQQMAPQMGLLPISQPAYYPGQGYSYGAPMADPSVYFGQPAQGIAPPMVPVPMPVPAPNMMMPPQLSQAAPPPPDISNKPRHMEDPLDQLLEDGNISKEDYLKLKPKDREPAQTVDLKEKVKILSRCNDAATKLGKLHLPNRVIVSGSRSPEQKVQTTFSSPLRREPGVNYNFTSTNSSSKLQPHKQLVDSITATIGHREDGVRKSPLSESKYKDSSTQTTSAFCETCEIRQLTHSNNKSTWVDSEHFSSSVHTQVIEAELAKSKTMFTPFGSNSGSASISMSHLTPAQLIVSQLAARAKKLEQPTNNTEGNFGRRPNDSDKSYYSHNKYRY